MNASNEDVRKYIVSFYKVVMDDYGRDHEICQQQLEIVAADRRSALAEDVYKFCEREEIADWSLRADRFEIDEQQG